MIGTLKIILSCTNFEYKHFQTSQNFNFTFTSMVQNEYFSSSTKLIGLSSKLSNIAPLFCFLTFGWTEKCYFKISFFHWGRSGEYVQKKLKHFMFRSLSWRSIWGWRVLQVAWDHPSHMAGIIPSILILLFLKPTTPWCTETPNTVMIRRVYSCHIMVQTGAAYPHTYRPVSVRLPGALWHLLFRSL